MSEQVRKVLNVGGGPKTTPMPAIYQGWEQVYLDVDPRCKPDVVCDARELTRLKGGEFDAVYCSQNIEHYYRHDAIKVLLGFVHVLKADGFAHVLTPDIGELMRVVVEKNLDIDDVLYPSPAGLITVRDVIYGFGQEIERSGADFFAHKTGFTKKSLSMLLGRCGFPYVLSGSANMEVVAYGFRNPPGEFARALLKLPAS